MAHFHFPTLVIQGRFDLNVTPDISWTVAHTIPGAQLVWFEKSGHLPYYEEPDKYVMVVNQFLLDHDATHD
jgi:proline iminopeptidase